ncbi:MAG: TRAP transporter large permease subunit [Bauldia sp.]|nr:TRAP transporter large permease subunit [Bauldia sp.]MCW5717695.1 TRAP transporter large permease subunit [Bauldia sp.]
MTDPQVALLMLGAFIVVIALGFPIAFTLMAMAVGFGYYAYFEPARMWRVYYRAVEDGENFMTLVQTWLEGLMNNQIFSLLVSRAYAVMSSDVLVAVPLFLFMGYIVERSNIVGKLFTTINVAAARLPGSLAVAALITSTLFATSVGIVGAVITLMGLLAFPAMLRAGYNHSFAAGVICAGGTLGILIPPSVMLIVYGASAGVSVVQLYAAALLPGFLLAGMYIAYTVIRAWLQPHLAPKPRKEDIGEFTRGQILWMMVTSFLPLALLIFAVLGSILFGLATPSEAAAVGVFGGLVLAAMYRSLTWRSIRESVYLTVRTAAMVCWLFVGSWAFASVFSYLGGEQLIGEFVQGLDLHPIVFLILAQIIIFVLGWPLEWSEIVIIFVPIFLPLLEFFDIDPLFFGILVALNLQTSFLTPPMAMSAYYLKGIAPPSVKLTSIFRGCLPFVGIVLFAMVLVYLIPGLVYWLPEMAYNR